MPKKSGPDFKKELVPVQRCRTCMSKGVVEGIFYQLPCEDCKGIGWVAQPGHEASLEEIARALGAKVNKVESDLAERIRISVIADKSDSEWNNKKGPGGSHYRGD